MQKKLVHQDSQVIRFYPILISMQNKKLFVFTFPATSTLVRIRLRVGKKRGQLISFIILKDLYC